MDRPSSYTNKSLLEILELTETRKDTFCGGRGEVGWHRVFGGQVLGQAFVAACKTVDPDRIAHSLHGYFILAGDPKVPIEYEVERTRDGGSFTTRRINAIQHGKSIFTMMASFQRSESGLVHQFEMPDVPPPEDIQSVDTLIAQHSDKLPKAMLNYWKLPRPIEMRPVNFSRYLGESDRRPVQHMWLKSTSELPDDPVLHQAILAYASDYTLLDTALIPHDRLMFDPHMMMASLDHAIWFHRSAKIDDWVLYTQDSPSTQNSRGLCRGALYSRAGELIASTAQEGLIRIIDE